MLSASLRHASVQSTAAVGAAMARRVGSQYRWYRATSPVLNENIVKKDQDGAGAKDEPMADAQSVLKSADDLLSELTNTAELLKTAQETLEQEKAKAADFKDKYVRALAEAENVRRRMKIEVDNQRQFAIQKFAQSLLQVLDIFSLAADNVPKEELEKENPALKNLHSGLSMTRDELLKVFKQHGIEAMEPLGQKFDPNAHEALFELDDPSKEPGTVAVVQKNGYTLAGRTLRAAVVGVVRDRS